MTLCPPLRGNDVHESRLTALARPGLMCRGVRVKCCRQSAQAQNNPRVRLQAMLAPLLRTRGNSHWSRPAACSCERWRQRGADFRRSTGGHRLAVRVLKSGRIVDRMDLATMLRNECCSALQGCVRFGCLCQNAAGVGFPSEGSRGFSRDRHARQLKARPSMLRSELASRPPASAAGALVLLLTP